MDIRKFFNKGASGGRRSSARTNANVNTSEEVEVDTEIASNKMAASTPKTRSTRPKRSRKVVIDDDDDHDDDYMQDAEAIVDVDDNDEVEEVVAVKKKSAAKAKPRAKRGATASAVMSTKAGSAFGGSDIPENMVAKKKWVPRSDNPPNRGNKERPRGASNCFAGMVCVITGILDSLIREECVDLIKEHGGLVRGAPSKKTTHGIIGMEPGESKMKKLKQLGVPIIDEDGLFDIMRKSCPQDDDDGVKKGNKLEEERKMEPIDVEIKPEMRARASTRGKNGAKVAPKPVGNVVGKLWVDKYSPKDVGDLVANPKHIKDLAAWLASWKAKYLHGDGHSLKLKDRGGSNFPAALLCGPPGVGKTSAAHAVCKSLGYEPLEFNASDVRNRGGILALADSALITSSITKFLSVSKDKRPTMYPNGQVLIMDEVDGMSGGDRGGSTELIKLIKQTKVPIICICNDDSLAKMRTLGGNCFKMKFRRPTTLQVKARLLDICRREGFNHVEEKTIEKLAEGCNGDIRQMINMLQTWRTQSATLQYGDVRDRLSHEGKTIMQRSVFDLAMSFFRPGPDGSVNSLQARTDNYFADADIVPLFVQENYISSNAASSSIDALADAAESISEGDLCNSVIRGHQRWDLMPAAAVLSSLRPGLIVAGGLGSQPVFPSFFGSLSKGNKFRRIVQELEMKVKVGGTTSGSVRAFRLDYIPTLTSCLATPLILGGADGVDEVIERLDAYYLEKDPDWTDILEVGVFPKGRAPFECISGAVKRVLTLEYKSRDHVRSEVTGVRFGATNRKAAAGADISKLASKAGEAGAVDVDPESGDEDEKKGDGDDVAEFRVKKKRAAAAKGTRKRASTGGGRGAAKKSKRGRKIK